MLKIHGRDGQPSQLARVLAFQHAMSPERHWDTYRLVSKSTLVREGLMVMAERLLAHAENAEEAIATALPRTPFNRVAFRDTHEAYYSTRFVPIEGSPLETIPEFNRKWQRTDRTAANTLRQASEVISQLLAGEGVYILEKPVNMRHKGEAPRLAFRTVSSRLHELEAPACDILPQSDNLGASEKAYLDALRYGNTVMTCVPFVLWRSDEAKQRPRFKLPDPIEKMRHVRPKDWLAYWSIG